MYAFVDVRDYQKVVVTDSSKGIEVAAENYLGDEKVINEESLKTNKIVIKDINTAVINGNTYYYILDTDNNKYRVSISVNDIIPFLNEEDKINVTYEDVKEVKEIIKLEK